MMSTQSIDSIIYDEHTIHGFYIRWLLISRCARMIRSLPKKIGFDDSFDVTKCLQQIEIPDTYAPCSVPPSNKTMTVPGL